MHHIILDIHTIEWSSLLWGLLCLGGTALFYFVFWDPKKGIFYGTGSNAQSLLLAIVLAGGALWNLMNFILSFF